MAIQTETDLGKVAIMPKGEWVIGVLYEILDMVTHNGNLYLSLKDTSVEPTDDGVNWMLLMEGVPVATEEVLGKIKPDGKTITIDPDGTVHGAFQVPEEVTFPLEVPNSKEIKFIGLEDVANGNKLVSHILYKNKNDLVLKLIDEKQHSEKEFINIAENDYGTDEVEINGNLSAYYVRTEGIDLGYFGSEKAITLTPGEAGNRAELFLQRKNENGYETLLEIDENGISHFFHSIDIKSGNLNLNNSNTQIINFKDYKITQNGNNDFFVISQDDTIGAFIQFSNSQNQINLHKNTNSLHDFFAHELIRCYVNKGIHFAQAGTVYHVYQKGQSGELLFDVVNLLNGSRTNVIDCNLDGTVTFAKKVKVLSDNPDYAALIEVNDCNFMLKGSTGSSFYPFMSVDIDSNEMTVYGDLILNEGCSLYIGSHIALSVYNFTSKIPTINFAEAISILTNIDTARSGIYFSDNFQKPAWQIVQSQHVAQGEWFLDFYYNDTKNNRNRLVYIGQNEMRVGIPLVAPNVSKMASDIVTAQQEITEQDLQLIETQQMLTEQELENIETKQLLTEMDLEKLEGGQAL